MILKVRMLVVCVAGLGLVAACSTSNSNGPARTSPRPSSSRPAPTTSSAVTSEGSEPTTTTSGPGALITSKATACRLEVAAMTNFAANAANSGGTSGLGDLAYIWGLHNPILSASYKALYVAEKTRSAPKEKATIRRQCSARGNPVLSKSFLQDAENEALPSDLINLKKIAVFQ